MRSSLSMLELYIILYDFALWWNKNQLSKSFLQVTCWFFSLQKYWLFNGRLLFVAIHVYYLLTPIQSVKHFACWFAIMTKVRDWWYNSYNWDRLWRELNICGWHFSPKKGHCSICCRLKCRLHSNSKHLTYTISINDQYISHHTVLFAYTFIVVWMWFR